MRAKSNMYRHQDAVASYFYEHDAVQAVVPMGGGKTCSALTAIRELIDDGVIRCALGLAPKRVAQLVWPKEVHEWDHLQDMGVSVVLGTEKQRMAALEVNADVYIVGMDNTQWLVDYLKTLPADHKLFDLLFIDELSRFKNPRGKRAKALRSVIKRWPIRWGMTGTPRPNGWEDQFMPMSLLTQNEIWGKSFDRWRDERFMALDFQGYSWTIRPEWRQRTIDDIATISVTIDPRDMPDMPELVTQIHWVELPPAARKVYKDMERKLLAPYKNGNKITLAANMAVATGKLAQMANGFFYTGDDKSAVEHLHSEKGDQLVELVEEMNGNPALLVYEFREDLSVMRDLYPGMPYFGSGISDADAARYEQQWNTRQLPQLGLHPASAGHGLNLQYGGDTMIVYGIPWSAENYDQMIKRYQRPGGGARCFLHLIAARDTVDQIKIDRVVNKMTEQQAFTNYLERI